MPIQTEKKRKKGRSEPSSHLPETPPRNKKQSKKLKTSPRIQTAFKTGPCRLYIAVTEADVALVIIKAAGSEDQAFFFPILKKSRDNPESFARAFHLSKVYEMRSKDGQNKTCPASSHPKDGYEGKAFEVFARIFTDNEDTSEKALKQWATNIAAHFTAWGQQPALFRHAQTYRYCGNITPTGAKKPPLAKYLLDDDVVQLLKEQYSALSLSQVAESDETLAAYFGESCVQEAKQILAREEQNMANLELSEDENDEDQKD